MELSFILGHQNSQHRVDPVRANHYQAPPVPAEKNQYVYEPDMPYNFDGRRRPFAPLQNDPTDLHYLRQTFKRSN